MGVELSQAHRHDESNSHFSEITLQIRLRKSWTVKSYYRKTDDHGISCNTPQKTEIRTEKIGLQICTSTTTPAPSIMFLVMWISHRAAISNTKARLMLKDPLSETSERLKHNHCLFPRHRSARARVCLTSDTSGTRDCFFSFSTSLLNSMAVLVTHN